MVSKLPVWDNHDIPLSYENYTVIITKRGNEVFANVPFNSTSRTDEPYRENGMDIFLRHSWQMAYKICWNYKPSSDERGRVLRAVRKQFFSDAEFFKHIESES